MNRDIPIIIYYATHIGENASKFCKVRYLSHCADLGDVCSIMAELSVTNVSNGNVANFRETSY